MRQRLKWFLLGIAATFVVMLTVAGIVTSCAGDDDKEEASPRPTPCRPSSNQHNKVRFSWAIALEATDIA